MCRRCIGSENKGRQEEDAEKERRISNVIAWSPRIQGTGSWEANEEDRDKVEAFINRMVHSDFPVKQAIRLGKQDVGNNDKARPLKVVLG